MCTDLGYFRCLFYTNILHSLFVYTPAGGDLVQIHSGMQEVGHSRGC